MIRRFLTQTCIIRRYSEKLDEYETPSGGSWDVVGQFPCNLQMSSSDITQGKPGTRVTNVYTIFLAANADIKAGDLVEIDGLKYRCSEPNRPMGRYTEVTATFEGEI